MKNNWLKLYHEILSDPKMGRMNDHLFRRTIELFLLAGQEGKDGLLPDIDGIAWSLHTTVKDIQTVINSLIKLNIVEKIPNIMAKFSEEELPMRYRVKHFEIRQKSEQTKSESNRAYYEKQKLKKAEIQSETNTEIQSEIQYVDIERDKDIDIDKDKEENKIEREIKNAPPKIQKHRRGNFSHVLLTDDEVNGLSADYGYDIMLMYVQKLDDYLENNPAKHYANHNLTIRRWIEKDEKKKQTSQKPQQKAIDYAEFGRMLDEQERNVIDL